MRAKGLIVMARIVNTDVPGFVASLTPFKGNTIEGEWRRSPGWRGYWAEDEVWDAFEADFTGGEDVFVVWSYSTPIAWWSPKFGWVAPAVKYSKTTSRHQNLVMQGIGPRFVETSVDGLSRRRRERQLISEGMDPEAASVMVTLENLPLPEVA